MNGWPYEGHKPPKVYDQYPDGCDGNCDGVCEGEARRILADMLGELPGHEIPERALENPQVREWAMNEAVLLSGQHVPEKLRRMANLIYEERMSRIDYEKKYWESEKKRVTSEAHREITELKVQRAQRDQEVARLLGVLANEVPGKIVGWCGRCAKDKTADQIKVEPINFCAKCGSTVSGPRPDLSPAAALSPKEGK